MKTILLALAGLSVLVTACTSTKAIYTSESNFDYNQRKEFSHPKLHKRINPVGITFVVGCTAAGAYFAKDQNIIVFNKGAESRQSSAVANSIVGGAVGMGFGALCNYIIAGQGKIKPVESESMKQKWIRNYDRNLVNITVPGRFDPIEVMHKSAQNSYKVATYLDAKHFFVAFPRSNRKDDIFEEALAVVDRKQVLQLMEDFPNSKHLEKAKEKYCDLSASYAEVEVAKSKFPNVNYDFEEKFSKVISSCAELKKFIEVYTLSSRYLKQALVNSFSSAYDANEARAISQKLDTRKLLSSADFGNKSSTLLKNYLGFYLDAYVVKNLGNMEEVVDQVQWIKLPSKNQILFDYAWNIADRMHYRGTEVIQHLGNIFQPSDNDAVSLKGFTTSEFNEYMKLQLQSIAQKEVLISKGTVKSSMELSNWNEWQHSIGNAFFVREQGNIIYIYSGTVKNTSKFALPVKLDFGALLYYELDETVPILGISMFDVANFMTKLTGHGEKMENPRYDFPMKKESFYLPVLQPGEETNYTIVFDYGKGIPKIGLDVLFLKLHTQLKMKEIVAQANYFDDNIVPSLIELQRRQLQLTYPKMNTTMYEVFKKYDPEDYRYKPQQAVSVDQKAQVQSQNKESNVTIRATQPERINRENTYISVYSRGDEKDSNKNYSTIVRDKDGKQLKSINDSYEDNLLCIYGSYHFPITVSTAYQTYGKSVSATVIIKEPGYSYTLEVEKN